VRANVDPDRLRRVAHRDDEHGLVIRESGVLAAEGLLTTRFLMYPSVYLHHTVRASESILLEAIRVHRHEDGATLADLERLTDDALLHRLRSAGGTAAALVERLDERRLYKRAYEGRPDRFEDEVVQKLIKDPGHRRAVAADIAERAGLPPHEVLLDVPSPPRFRETRLWVRRLDGEAVPITEASQLVRILHEARLDHWRFWVFAPKRHQDVVAKAARAVLG
jgi:uncharacterized protein